MAASTGRADDERLRSIELTLLGNRLVSVCREMGVAMMRTAY